MINNHIRFKETHVSWKKYSLLLKKWRKACDINQKKLLKKKLKVVRQEAVLENSCYVTNVILGVIV